MSILSTSLISTKEGYILYVIGKINPSIYKCITNEINCNDVVITENQIQHIKERHPNDFERYATCFKEIIENPDYIIETQKPNTALILKTLSTDKLIFKTILRLVTPKDNPNYKNSIITFMKIDEKELNRLIKNKKILYKKD